MAAEPVGKPLPEPDEASRPFWDGTQLGRLMLMRCRECGTYRLPSRAHCNACLADSFDWAPASGRGVVRSFAIMHQQYHPAFAAELPYDVTIVELEEGPRIPTNLVEIENADIRVGMKVVVDWERHEDVSLPKFRPDP